MNDKLSKQQAVDTLKKSPVTAEIIGVIESIYENGGFVRSSHLEPLLAGRAGMRYAKRLKTEKAYKHMMASKRGMLAKGVKE